MKRWPVNIGKIKDAKFQQISLSIRFTKRGWMWILLPSYFFIEFFTCSLCTCLVSQSRDPLTYRMPVFGSMSIIPAFSPDILKLTAGGSSMNYKGKITEGKKSFFQHFHHNKNNFMLLWLLRSIANSVFGWENDTPRVCSNTSALFWSSTEEFSHYFLNAARNLNCSLFPKQTSA